MLRQELGRLSMERIFLDYQLSEAKKEIEDLKSKITDLEANAISQEYQAPTTP